MNAATDKDIGRKLFARGIHALRQRNLPEAVDSFREFLELHPRHPECQHLLGNALGQMGELDEAEKLTRNAITANGGRGVYFNTLANVQKRRGDIERAMATYRKAIELEPDLIGAHYNLGVLYAQAGDDRRAHEAFDEALRIRPDYPGALNQKGVLLQNCGDTSGAMRLFENAIQIEPRFPQAHNNLGAVYLFRGKFAQATRCFDNALRYDPDYAGALFNMGLARRSLGQLEAALECLTRANELVPDQPNVVTECAAVVQATGDLDRAESLYRQALALDPQFVAATAGLAELFEWRGEIAAGVALLEPLGASLDPRVALVRARLAHRAGDHETGLSLLEPLTAADRQASVSSALKRQLHHTLGDLHDVAGHFDQAFAHYRLANLSRNSTFDAAAHARAIARLTAFFTSERVARLPATDRSAVGPLFIVGMPRSGTSLIEQMLAMHSQIQALGERPDVGGWPAQLVGSRSGFVYPDDLDSLTGEHFATLARSYLAAIEPVDPSRRWVSDKMPLNYLHLGLIDRVFPRARVIHCVRDPMAVALSCFRQDFIDSQLDFSLDLGDTGDYYAAYGRLMAHWNEVLSLPIIAVRYEDLTGDPEGTLRDLSAFLDLEFESDCLEFHHSNRFVNTASHNQVRRTVYRSSIGHYKNYQQYLASFTQALESGRRQNGSAR